MSEFPELQAALRDEVWPITRSAYDSLKADVENVQAAANVSSEKLPSVLSIDGDTATIRIQGILAFKPSLLAKILLGVSDITEISAAINRIWNDESIKRVVAHVTSPGGQGSGVAEAAGLLAHLPKQTTAYIEGIGASAAYWIACACDRIACSPGSICGSVGVYATFTDTSEAQARAGIREIVIASGDLKGAGESGSLSDAQLDHKKQNVSDFADLFFSFVRSKRPRINPEVFRGGAYVGARAKSLGLVDEIGNFESMKTNQTRSGMRAETFSDLVAMKVGTGLSKPDAIRAAIKEAPHLHTAWRAAGGGDLNTAADGAGAQSFPDLVREKVAAGATKSEAIVAASRARPDLHLAYVRGGGGEI